MPQHGYWRKAAFPCSCFRSRPMGRIRRGPTNHRTNIRARKSSFWRPWRAARNREHAIQADLPYTRHWLRPRALVLSHQHSQPRPRSYAVSPSLTESENMLGYHATDEHAGALRGPIQKNGIKPGHDIRRRGRNAVHLSATNPLGRENGGDCQKARHPLTNKQILAYPYEGAIMVIVNLARARRNWCSFYLSSLNRQCDATWRK